ncbi:transcriptional regulator with XRE-family HTH domain [Sedimentibacter acidaminivorans]|jgi:transcriptional regulator with XRE-family HTH domain|uniref:Transcriptional regulator with XRE-family HTH domain n=1 Tax=Sedimentibacter acidaminivorans TaxID=913099 RepID=A0ABS4GDI8_9FIRM|nr:XRE family transcriptional regulator [Sedimentibacter acidaminivorans]MBP1925572.1 transcriptional regulator with XRE-family HTH domain [Sedimentibacter acidaminivorans]
MDGNKVRSLRKKKSMTIDDLSLKSGFTASYISQVERNLIEPSLSALSKICKVLEISPYYFIDNDDNVIITRKEDRQKLLMGENDKEIVYLLPINSEKKSKFKFDAYETKIEPGKWDSTNFIIIDSDKFVIIKKGTLLVKVNDDNEILQEGDSIYICSNTPHNIYNPTEEISEILCIISPQAY